jgi:hypothetical protein
MFSLHQQNEVAEKVAYPPVGEIVKNLRILLPFPSTGA